MKGHPRVRRRSARRPSYQPGTKYGLCAAVAAATGFSIPQCQPVLEAMLRVITEHLLEGRSVEIKGFGTFYPKWRKPRPARDIRRGIPVWLPRRRVALLRWAPGLLTPID